VDEQKKHLQPVIDHTASMYGSIRGIAEPAIALVKSLELPNAPAGPRVTKERQPFTHPAQYAETKQLGSERGSVYQPNCPTAMSS
jgi:hypothetical protein